MKIGIIVGYRNDAGGITHVTNHIIRALSTKHDLVMCTFSRHKSDIIANTSVLPFRLGRMIVLQRSLGSYIAKSSAGDCDMLIYTDGTASIPDTDKPILIYNHSGFRTWQKNQYRGLRKLYYKVYEDSLQHMTQKIRQNKNGNIHIVTNSQYTSKMVYEDVGKDSTVIYPPVNTDKFRLKADDAHTFAKRDRDGVITVSTFHPLKNYTFTCKVMSRVKPACNNYTILGNVNTPIERKHYEQIHAQYPDVTMIPNVDLSVVSEMLSKSKVYFHAKIEDFGISIVEAIAAGCIPIVPDAGGLLETVPIPELRFEYNNYDDAQAKIEDALSGKYDHHVAALQKHMMQFDTSVFERKILNLVDSLKYGGGGGDDDPTRAATNPV